MKNQSTKSNLEDLEEIKRVNLEHCVKVLEHNPLSNEAKMMIEIETDIHQRTMEDNQDADTYITKDQYDTTIQKFKVKNKRSYDFLIKAGEGFQDFIYKLCRRMIKEESFPERFSETILYILWKRKGSRGDLNNHRYIHLKDWLPRLAESLTADMMKDDIFERGSRYQIAGVPGHRMEEHLVSLKCIIGRYISKGAGWILQLVDIKKFFNKERLGTVRTSLARVEVNKKAYRC